MLFTWNGDVNGVGESNGSVTEAHFETIAPLRCRRNRNDNWVRGPCFFKNNNNSNSNIEMRTCEQHQWQTMITTRVKKYATTNGRCHPVVTQDEKYNCSCCEHCECDVLCLTNSDSNPLRRTDEMDRSFEVLRDEKCATSCSSAAVRDELESTCESDFVPGGSRNCLSLDGPEGTQRKTWKSRAKLDTWRNYWMVCASLLFFRYAHFRISIILWVTNMILCC